MLFADVCVNTPLGGPDPRSQGPESQYDPLGRTFTYSVPDRLADRLEPGHLVWVPFRGRRLQGVVLRLSDAAPQFDTREMLALVWARPLLTPAQLALARWVSERYLAPLIESLRLMMPAGLSQRGRTVLVRTPVPVPSGLSSRQTALLERIGRHSTDWSEAKKGLQGATQKADLEPLIELGLVTREVEFPSPPPRPKTDRQVRLLADARTVARVLPGLGRRSKQADALAWLASQCFGNPNAPVSGPLPAPARTAFLLEEVCGAVGCTRSSLEALARRGWVTVIPGASRAAPTQVSLLLTQEAVVDALVELRGTYKHRAVLQALLTRGEPAWIGWVYAQTGATLDTLRDLEAAGLLTIAEEMIWRDPLSAHEFVLDQPPELTGDQQRAWEAVLRHLDRSRVAAAELAKEQPHSTSGDAPTTAPNRDAPSTILLHGVTGSGKTEIYLRAISEVLARGQQAVVLVPEIALTPQTIRRFAARFPGKVTIWHSELGDGERFDVWRRVRTGHPAAQVVVGSRSALFLPFPDLGVIVLDEEHEPSYKQERTPRYHARIVAMQLGRLCRAPVVLGSATPALETYYAAKRGEIDLVPLEKRIIGHGFRTEETADLPEVRVVDMRQELRAGNRSMFSRALSSGLRRVLASGQQAILYLNRRGAATFVLCRDCGHVEACPRCSVPLTFHSEGEQLVCHHCNRRFPAPSSCPSCGGRRIRHFGTGTERVEEAVKLEFPEARTLRWDSDVTGSKGAHDAILTRFSAHQADVLIGTQMIAKGLDLPLVTLVGVIAADTGLFLPDFRAAERTFQLLTQVAGRAGRSALGGEVIVQTYHPDHYAVVAASNHDYDAFYRQEMAFRREQGYPPIRRLVRLVLYGGQRARVQAEAARLAKELSAAIAEQGLSDTDLIGPAPCFFARQRSEYRWHLIVRGPEPVSLVRRIALPLGWRVDVDPIDLL